MNPTDMTILPGTLFFVDGSTMTPNYSSTQLITIPFAAAALLESLCAGGNFPYLTTGSGAQPMYPSAFKLVLRNDATDIARLMFDGGTPTALVGENIPQEPADGLYASNGVSRVPANRIRVIAAVADQPAIVTFFWENGRV